MEDINRIKVVLVEKKELGNGWQKNLEKILQQSRNGVPTPLSQTFQL